MSRIDQRTGRTNDVPLMAQYNQGWSLGTTQPMIDIGNPGAHGFSVNYPTWLSNNPHVDQNIFAILLEAPTGFDVIPNAIQGGRNLYTDALKAIVETRSQSITGLAKHLTVEVDNKPMGASELFDVPVNVTRAKSNITMTLPELYGKSMTSFLESWIQWLIMDPESKVPNIVTLPDEAKPNDLMADVYSFTALYFEPDPTMRSVVDAWLVFNQFPIDGWERTGQRQKTSAKSVKEFSVTFTGISQCSLGVNIFAQRIMSMLNFTNANPMFAQAANTKIESNVEGAKGGITDNLQQIRDSNISDMVA